MAKKKKFVDAMMFLNEFGEEIGFDGRRRNANGSKLCTHEHCNNVAKFMGNGRDQGLYCLAHLYGKYSEDGDYRNFKYRYGYCQNVDGRLGRLCTTSLFDWSMVEVDHINGNHDDGRDINKQCLCSSCHRYKSRVFKGLHDLDKMWEIMNANIEYFKNIRREMLHEQYIPLDDMYSDELLKMFASQQINQAPTYELILETNGQEKSYEFDASEKNRIKENLNYLKTTFGDYRYYGETDLLIPKFVKI